MPSSTRRFVYRAVRFFVSVAFPDLTRRAGHPRLRDDVGIVPEVRLPGGSFFRFGGILRFDRAGRASQIADDMGIVPYAGSKCVRFDRAQLRTQSITGPGTMPPP